MAHLTPTSIAPGDILRSVRQHPRRLVVPVVVVTLLAAVYAVVRPSTWEAAQALIVRDEAAGSTIRPGKFGPDEMKTTQETILELVKSRPVLSQALAEVGPAPNADSGNWPTARDVEALQGALKLSPPKGAEFGKTEVFYLKLQNADRQRAVDLASAVCNQLQKRFEQLRKARAESIIGELQKTAALAEADLTESTRKLTQVEQSIGRDLAELRILNELPSGDSDLRRSALELETELRTYRAAQRTTEELLQLLTAAQADPGRLLASPLRLLESQPALRRLKDGLVDAQLRTAKLQGTMSEAHPQVQAAQAAEQEISKHLHDEIAIAIKGLEMDLRLNKDRVETLRQQSQSVQDRLGRLATVRAEYSNLVMATRQRADIFRTAQQELSEARASLATSQTTSLISAIDQPDTGSRPMGPGRTVIVLAGALAGLLTGTGILLLTVQPSTQSLNAKATHNGYAIGGAKQVIPGWAKPNATPTLKQALRKLTSRFTA